MLLVTNAFAINQHHSTDMNKGYLVKSIVKAIGSFETKEKAIQVTKDLTQELQSGTLSIGTK
jgi:hypothetical protein